MIRILFNKYKSAIGSFYLKNAKRHSSSIAQLFGMLQKKKNSNHYIFQQRQKLHWTCQQDWILLYLDKLQDRTCNSDQQKVTKPIRNSRFHFQSHHMLSYKIYTHTSNQTIKNIYD